MSEQPALSEREIEILRMVATGASNKEIAQRLAISTNTVKVHLRNVFAKIDVASRTEATMWAVRNGLIEAGTAAEQQTDGDDQDLENDTPAEEAQAIPVAQAPRRKLPLWLSWGAIAIALLAGALLIGNIILQTLTGNPGQTATPPGEVLIPAAERAQLAPSLLLPRSNPAAIGLNGQVYTFAGVDEQGVTGRVEVYDPQTGRWQALPNKPVPARGIQAAALAGLIFVPGGESPAGQQINVVEVFDPATQTWGTVRSLPAGTSDYALAALEGSLYLFGGIVDGEVVDTVYRYDPDLDTWVLFDRMPISRAYGGAAVIGGRIYIAGGMNQEGEILQVDVYQPGIVDGADPERAWSLGPQLPGEYIQPGVIGVLDLLYVIGGSTDPALPDGLVYAANAANWSALELYESSGWEQAGVAFVQPNIYFIGGQRADGKPVSDVLTYQAIFTVILPLISQ